LRLDPGKVGRGQCGLEVIARLRPGINAPKLRASLAVAAERLKAANP
jgi:hypothetical protein